MQNLNLRVKQKIGENYEFEKDGKIFGPSLTKESIEEKIKRSSGRAFIMEERLKAINDYKKMENENKRIEQNKLDEDFKKSGGMRNVIICDDFCNNEVGSMDNVILAMGGNNNIITSLENTEILGKFDNNKLGIKPEIFSLLNKLEIFADKERADEGVLIKILIKELKSQKPDKNIIKRLWPKIEAFKWTAEYVILVHQIYTLIQPLLK